MKTLALFTTLITLSTANPKWNWNHSPKCPTIPQIAPDGQLPPNTLSPALLMPISQKKPDKAYGATNTAIVTPHDKCTLTRFDIPASAQNKTCSLTLFLGGCGYGKSNVKQRGPGNIIFQGNTGVRYPVPGETTWNNQPPLAPPFDDAPVINKGEAYRLGGGPCDYTPGEPFTSVGGSICSEDTKLEFTQQEGGYGKCPVGFHLVIT
ncbi:hypothetical protein BDW02DRAFT_185708 [Decorospora gaudefroyi]|uniref:Ubiquitin 3 binding protein But2 C-terminal domain-containing protein n=1 Tax=Decorospora gaudefroyi TaxID=184978 RepID=A0A6A5JWM9_9PLEO|nr:hypothetical protein BDW02DRAFT_185708 [Decorospora gaudefroyi]